MSELFISVLNMSLTSSYVILFVLLIRLLLKKAPKVISYALWSAVAFRLIVPFSVESMFSLMPRNSNAVSIPHDIIYQQSPQINSGIKVIDSFVSQSLPAPSIGASANPLQVYVEIGAYIWIFGIIALLIYSIVSILVLKRKLKGAKLIEKNIFEAEKLKTPFVLGIVRPKIYLPVGLNATEKSYILLHEQTHIQRKDHLIKVLAFLILSIHWFNPLVWVAFILMSTDMELSCDERVLKEMNEDIKKPYAYSLLSLATGKHIINGNLLAFGEGNVKGRINNILNYKRPKFWVVTVIVIGVIIVAIGLISNPYSNNTLSIMWAKSLKTEDIQSIELIVQPSSQQERYKKYATHEYPEIVRLINTSNGRLIQSPEGIAGGGKTFYITTISGKVHTVTNKGNTYLVIDGDSFKAKYEWLSNWDYKGIDSVPDEFYERVGLKVPASATEPALDESEQSSSKSEQSSEKSDQSINESEQSLSQQENSISYSLMQLQYGEVTSIISPLSGEDAKLAEETIMSYMVISAAWPGIDISTLEECYLLRSTHFDGTISDDYAYLKDGRAVMQHGTDGYYSFIDNELYDKLVEIIISNNNVVDVLNGS